jgi:hypothetical protein
MLTSKFPQFSPSRLSKHLRTGLVQILHHILTTQRESWGFIKSSAPYQSIHMKLSFCLSFYLRRNLGGYTVDITAGFPAKIREALALQSRHRISRKCPQYHMGTCSATVEWPVDGGLEGYCQGRYPGYHRPLVTTQNSGYDQFPPAANN